MTNPKKIIALILGRELKSVDHLDKNKKIRVSFTGGLGAQLISAAIYYDLSAKGYLIEADLSYFEKKQQDLSGCSHWDWQLGEYGIYPSSFYSSGSPSGQFVKISDGSVKGRLGVSALRNENIRKKFVIPQGVVGLKEFLPESDRLVLREPYICMHIRRGDYMNVASYLVPDSHFIDIAMRAAGVLKSIVVLSDSPLSEEFKKTVAGLYGGALFIDSGGEAPFYCHCLMRNASLLVCSNSQFSLTAGLLSSGFVVLPKKWYGGGEEKLESLISELSDFAVMS